MYRPIIDDNFSFTEIMEGPFEPIANTLSRNIASLMYGAFTDEKLAADEMNRLGEDSVDKWTRKI
jgi:hypothetical protein